MKPGKEIVGVISLKHVYEIANFKSQDINCADKDLKKLCIGVLNLANRAGIKVVSHDLDPNELGEFLKARKSLEELELKDIAEKRALKMMRAAAAPASPAAKK